MPDRVLSRPKDPCALPCYESCCKRPVCQGVHHGPNPGIIRREHQIRNSRQIAPLHTYIHVKCMSDGRAFLTGMKCPAQQEVFNLQ